MTDVAIVIPVRDRAETLGAAIESSLSCEPAPSELVVVDCDSSDGTREIARSFGSSVEVVRSSARNAAAARNIGASVTSAPLIGFLDSDDEALPGKTGALGARLDLESTVGLVHGSVEVIDDAGRRSAAGDERLAAHRRTALELGTTYSALASFCSMYTSATLVRRDAFDEIGGYDEALDVYEDWDLYLRLATVSTLRYAEDPAARYRVWAGNVAWDRTARGVVEVAGKHLRALPPSTPDSREAAFGFQARLAASHYTLLELPEARVAAIAALRLDPRRALASREVRRSLTRWILPRSILQHRRPPRTD